MSGKTHFAATYYLPSWQGGNVTRPLCHKGRCGHGTGDITAADAGEVTCGDCLTLMEGRALPEKPAPAPRKRQPYVRIERQPLPPRPVVPLVLTPQIDRGPTMPEIAALVAKARGLTMEELRGESRKWEFAHPRQEAMWLMRRAGRTTTQIGKFFGRDHSTVVHAEQAYAGRMSTQQEAA